MKTIFRVLVVLVLTSSETLAQSPDWVWAKSIGGISLDISTSIAVDDLGNVYATGLFKGTADFNVDSTGIFNLSSSGGTDIFIVKLNASGNLIWAKQIGGTGDDGGYAIALDSAGNIYITGRYYTSVDFDPGIGTSYLPFGNPDIFVLKLDTSGNFIWAVPMSGGGDDCGNSISLDPAGNIYSTGYFTGIVDFDPGTSTYNLSGSGNQKTYISKLDNAGNFIWANEVSGISSGAFGSSVFIDKFQNVYATGNFNGAIDFDPGPGVFNLTSLSFHSDIFVLKLNSLGHFIWVKQIGGISNDGGREVVCDGSGNVYTTGYFYDTVDFNPDSLLNFPLTSAGNSEFFISKSDSAGNFIWTKAIGETSYDDGYSITVGTAGNIYATGRFSGTVDFDPGSSIFNLSSLGYTDVFIIKLDSSGNFIWSKAAAGNGFEIGHAIAINNESDVYITGQFNSHLLSFDNFSLANNDTSTIIFNNYDLFIARLDAVIGIDETQYQTNRISIYPNPTTSTCTITAHSFTHSILLLYDLTGRVLLQQAFNEQATMDVGALRAGMYLVEVRDKGGRSVKGRLVVRWEVGSRESC